MKRGRIKRMPKAESLSGLSLLRRLQIARYGDACDQQNGLGEAAQVVTFLREAIYLEKGFEGAPYPGVSNETTHKIVQDRQHRRAWDRLCANFVKAYDTADGTFFRNVADIIERSNKPVHDQREIIGRILQHCHEAQAPIPPVGAFVELARKCNVPMNFTSATRILKDYFGVAPPAGKSGRPRKANL